MEYIKIVTAYRVVAIFTVKIGKKIIEGLKYIMKNSASVLIS